LPSSIVAIALVALATPAFAQTSALAQGDAALASRSWPAAIEAFDRVLQDRTVSLDDLVRAHAALAWAHLALGDVPGSEREATEALALDPRAEPPSLAPDALRATFARVRAQRQGARIQIDVELGGPLVARRAATLHLRVSGLPSGDTARVSARCTSDGHEVAAVQFPNVGDGQYDAPVEALPPASPLDCDALIATRNGVPIGRRALRLVTQSEPGAHVVRESSGPNGWLVAGMITGAAAVATAVVIGFALTGGSTSAHLGTPTVMGP
jgi:hypothetical protein